MLAVIIKCKTPAVKPNYCLYYRGNISDPELLLFTVPQEGESKSLLNPKNDNFTSES